MAGKFLVSITNAKNDTDKATVGFVVANAALASGLETVIFLSTEGVRLSQNGYSNDIAEAGFKPLKELISAFTDNGGKIWVCSPCFKKRDLKEEELVEGATVVGGAKMVEFITQGAGSVSY